MKEVFELGHVALYAKGHYLRYTSPHSEHDNIIQDLKPLILADGYCGDIMSLKNMAELFLNKCKVLDVVAFTDLNEFVKGIEPFNTFRCGYLHADSPMNNLGLAPYDMNLAIIYYCLSNITFLSVGHFTKVEADFINVLPKNDKKY